MRNRIYEGERGADGKCAVVVWETAAGKWHPLAPRTDLINHSRSFGWGGKCDVVNDVGKSGPHAAATIARESGLDGDANNAHVPSATSDGGDITSSADRVARSGGETKSAPKDDRSNSPSAENANAVATPNVSQPSIFTTEKGVAMPGDASRLQRSDAFQSGSSSSARTATSNTTLVDSWAQLALAMLADARGDDFAVKHYQDFKWAFVATRTEDKWKLEEQHLVRMLEMLGAMQDADAPGEHTFFFPVRIVIKAGSKAHAAQIAHTVRELLAPGIGMLQTAGGNIVEAGLIADDAHA